MKYSPSMMHIITHERRTAMGCMPLRSSTEEQGAPKSIVCVDLETGEVIKKPSLGALDTVLNRGKNYTSGVLLSYNGWIKTQYFICLEESYDPETTLEELNRRCVKFWEDLNADRKRRAQAKKDAKRDLVKKSRELAPQKIEPDKIIIKLTKGSEVIDFPSNKAAAVYLGTQQSYVALCRRAKRLCFGYQVEAYYHGELIDPAKKKGRIPVIRPVVAIKDGVISEYKNAVECADALGIDRQRVYFAARTNTQSMGYAFKWV